MSSPAFPGAERPHRILWVFLLVAGVFLAYLPVWHAGFIWDDEGHVTKPGLRSLHGLWRIWFVPGASQQYYPLVHSVFWIEHRLWGDWPLPYHLLNVLLHAICAVLAGKVLQQLEVPGAWLAAFIFALHPVQVETAAWVTELKNTLSGVFCMAAALCYLDFDRERKRRAYAAALTFFFLGLLCKTVIATLPAALLVVFWWKRGRLSWRKDALPLLPFFPLGVAAGLWTRWMELTFFGVSGGEWGQTPVQRCLIAGRAVFFYLGKLLYPAKLTFIYPRWVVSGEIWWQWLYPAALIAFLAVLWTWRKRSRAPLAALLYFAGTLFPALGFVNVYPFRYSFVADHFQYLATLGPIALASASLTLFWKWSQRALMGVCGALLLTLGALTWQQCSIYKNLRTLWEATLERDPDCWMALSNLSILDLNEGRTEEALTHVRRALAIKPDYREGLVNLGNTLVSMGDVAGGIAAYEKSMALEPRSALLHNNLGNALLLAGRQDEAVAHFRQAIALDETRMDSRCALCNALLAKGEPAAAIAEGRLAVEIDPEFSDAHLNLANALLTAGGLDEAIAHYREAVRLKPRSAIAHFDLGAALMKKDRLDEAVVHFRAAREMDPAMARAHDLLGKALLRKGDANGAVDAFQTTLTLEPQRAETHYNLGLALMLKGAMREAMAEWRAVLYLSPENSSAFNQLAWVMATSPDPGLRNGFEALELARQAVRLSGGSDPTLLDTLAAAQAECRQFPAALETARRARDLAQVKGDIALADALSGRLKLYEAGSPFREPVPTTAH